MLVTVDTGGTKTLVSSFSEDGILGEVVKFPTPKTTSEYVKLLTETLLEEYGGQSVDAVVIAIPGIIKDGVAVWCNNLGWANFDVAKAFKGVLGDAPVLIENDANLAGLAEARSLTKTPPSVLYITVSTGVGTGVISHGRIDANLQHGQGGMTMLEFDGSMHQWEKFASGQAIYKMYHKFGRDIHSKRTWRQIADRISRGLLALTPILQPDIIIVGGSIGVYFDQFIEPLTDILKKNMPPHIAVPKIVQAKHPEQAVIYGCYYYALDALADTAA
ncbi:ROK family protein [Patescibacteria group bacterium]|nr:MAG: ROK family protein [Patescibacteria group bacterium]